MCSSASGCVCVCVHGWGSAGGRLSCWRGFPRLPPFHLKNFEHLEVLLACALILLFLFSVSMALK